MKIKGKKIEGINVELIVIPRGNGEHLVFKAQAVLNYDEFLKLVPEPVPPKSQRKGGEWFDNLEDSTYLKATALRYELETDWMCIQSLKATTELEWETVELSKPSTWASWRTELTASGFIPREVAMVITGVFRANALSERMIKEARDSFFQSHPEERRS